MKVGILTFHNAHNYGAVLQAYALKTCIEKMGHETHIVNYHNRKIKNQYPKCLIPRLTCKDLHPRRWKQYIYDTLRGIYGQKVWSKQWISFEQFISKYLLDGNHEVITSENISKYGYDVLVFGSDQIWSSVLTGGLDTTYFGKFRTSEKTVSYAASLANASIEEDEKTEFVKLLEYIDVISVREEKLAELLKQLSGREIETTVDPTLLLDETDYESLLETEREVPNEPYVFAYYVVENKELQECAQKLAREANMPLIELHYYHMPECSDKNQFADFGPSEFLKYIKNADYVITNSFHGTVFSILYQRTFYSVYKKNGRVDNLLTFLNIKERHIEAPEEVDISQEIDYVSVHHKLKEYREHSIEFLLKNISE